MPKSPRMRFDKPKVLAFSIALLVASLVLLSLWLFVWLGAKADAPDPRLLAVALALAVALLTFLAARFGVEQFIYSRVKVIYKNIHDLKLGRRKGGASRSSDLDLITREVAEWANQRRTEIADLRARENFRREFIGNISHELKTPIFNIQGYLLTLLDGAIDDPEINHRYLKRANKSVDRMIAIIEDLEIISALESNSVQLQITRFELVSLVEETFELLRDAAKKRRIRLAFAQAEPKAIYVRADRAKIEQVLVNLISNAIKYGREKGSVQLAFRDRPTKVLVEVHDDGLGIPADDVPRVFERFYRVDKSRSREAGGTGLGLSIVKHIIEAHQETINVRSVEDEGSSFSFSLEKAK